MAILAAAHVDRHHHARPVGRDDLVEEVDVAERGRADDHALRAGAQRVAHGADRAQAAAVLDRDAGSGDDPSQVVERARLARARAVEVDDVEVARARLDPRARGLERVVVVDGLLVEVALASRTACPSRMSIAG